MGKALVAQNLEALVKVLEHKYGDKSFTSEELEAQVSSSASTKLS